MINRFENINKYDKNELINLIATDEYDEELRLFADIARRQYYEDTVYVRGLIEISNCCKNDCLYCGIRVSNHNISRYRLTADEILDCCHGGYKLGFRTFVLQGGEDLSYSDKDICNIVSCIKEKHPDCAVTLSIGEKSRESYKSYFDAGADRYLLRHESANCEHYKRLHPEYMSLENRKKCLYDLKEIGYQVGAGFMVGSPYQTVEYIAEDLCFLKELEPDMIGIGPFIAHKDTPFSTFENGSLELTLRLISILRLLFPYALIPATTALGTISENGRERGLQAGANVLMPNLSPDYVREKYELYDNKLCTGDEAAEGFADLKKRVAAVGYRIVTDIGNVNRKVE